MGTLRGFQTETIATNATSGSTTGLTPAGSGKTLQDNTTQIIIYNKSSTEVLYIFCYAVNVDAGAINLRDAIEITAGAYLTLSLGQRSESVGSRVIVGFNTGASSFDFKLTEIMGITN